MLVTDPLVDVSPLPSGGTNYTYRQANRNLVSEPVPPANFDAVNASASQLVEYALPPRPTLPAALVEWNQEMSRAWFSTPPPFLAEIPKAAQIPPPSLQSPSNPGIPSFPINYGIFAGYQTFGGQGPFTSADATYNEPALHPTSCQTPGVATWAGIGSANSPFGQDGTWSLNAMPNHQGFFSVWLNGTMYTTGVLNFSKPIVGGHVIRANVNYRTYTDFYGTVTDVTTGETHGWSYPLFAGQAPNSGEALAEKLVGPPPYDLANFKTLTFTSTTANGKALNSYGYVTHDILNGTSVANTSPISGNGSFSVVQVHC